MATKKQNSNHSIEQKGQQFMVVNNKSGQVIGTHSDHKGAMNHLRAANSLIDGERARIHRAK